MHVVNVKGAAGWRIVALASVVSVAAVNDTRLIDAVKHSNVKRVQALVRERVDVNATAADGATALHWAVHKDDLPTADLLIRAGARPNVTNDLGVTPLHLACTNRSTGMVRRLLAPDPIQTRHCSVVRPCSWNARVRAMQTPWRPCSRRARM
jgi:ankyrin repeat protein